jgi:hypothetical protein
MQCDRALVIKGPGNQVIEDAEVHAVNARGKNEKPKSDLQDGAALIPFATIRFDKLISRSQDSAIGWKIVSLEVGPVVVG